MKTLHALSNKLRFVGTVGLLAFATTGCDYGAPVKQAPPATPAPPVTQNADPSPVPTTNVATASAAPETNTAPPVTNANPPSTPVAPPTTPPIAPPATNSLAAATSYLANSEAVAELLVTVVDSNSAKAAAEPLQKLAAEQRPLIRPYWLWVTTLSSDEKVKFATERAMEMKKFEKRHGPSAAGPGKLERLVTIAKEPGNEAFKSALAALLQANVDESPRTAAASYQKLLDKLNQ